MRADFGGYMSEDILVKVDRASMLTSLEVRAPLLATSIIEFAYGRLPDDLKVRGRNKKIALKMLGKKYLPKNYQYDRKQGFSVPESWLGARNAKFLEDILHNIDRDLLNFETVEHLINRQINGATNMKGIFTLCMFELWRREYNVSS